MHDAVHGISGPAFAKLHDPFFENVAWEQGGIGGRLKLFNAVDLAQQAGEPGVGEGVGIGVKDHAEFDKVVAFLGFRQDAFDDGGIFLHLSFRAKLFPSHPGTK